MLAISQNHQVGEETRLAMVGAWDIETAKKRKYVCVRAHVIIYFLFCCGFSRSEAVLAVCG